ncbi:MAG: reprolysin-like metallopeptidase, partial [Chthoniobacteraceae bacterium]
GIDQIWAQAGIDVEFKFRLAPFDDTFSLLGNSGNNSPRPTGDLNAIVSAANASGGVLDANPKVINLLLVRIVPGFSQTTDNTANGLAFQPGNGIALWAGSNLSGFSSGRDVISSVLAHEIGHNLGLSHVTTAQNLMQSGGPDDDGERLTASQIATARGSSFLVSVPEPGVSSWLIAIGLALAIRRRR